jgi:hypothetical protein
MSTDAHHVPLSQADRLRQDAEAAAEVRALSNHPDVIALRVERVRTQVDALLWVGIGLGLAFTMVNVQTFAAAGAAMWSLPWCAAWLLDPMVSLTLVAVLRAEQITARYQVSTGVWAKRTKWFAFVATYVMNTWQSWSALHPSGIALHSVPPVLVLCAAETAPWLRDRLTEAVTRAARTTFTGTADETNVSAQEAAPLNTATGVHEVAKEDVPAPARTTRPARRRAAAKKPTGRKLLADYVADARTAWVPGVEITPVWARQETGCSRGLSPKVAETLRAEIASETDTASVAAAEPEGEREAA